MALFTGRLSITVDLDLDEAEAELLAENLKTLLEERLAYLDVSGYTINVEKFSS